MTSAGKRKGLPVATGSKTATSRTAATPPAATPKDNSPRKSPSDPPPSTDVKAVQQPSTDAKSKKKKTTQGDDKLPPCDQRKKKSSERKKPSARVRRKYSRGPISMRYIDAPAKKSPSTTTLTTKTSEDLLKEVKSPKPAKETPKKPAPVDDFFPAADLILPPQSTKSSENRPLSETSLKMMSDRVKQKKRSREQAEKRTKVKPGDCPFPKYVNLKTTEEPTKYSQYAPITGLDSQRISSNVWLARAMKKIKNNDNNGRLIVKDSKGKDRPFWLTDTVYRPQVTDDEFILNAETVGDVIEGKVLLDGPAPEWTKQCNVVGKLSILQDKDQAAFRNPTIYRNSVRSMIEIVDTPRPKPEELVEYAPVEFKFNEPTAVHLYDRENLNKVQTTPYVPGEWKILDNGTVIRLGEPSPQTTPSPNNESG